MVITPKSPDTSDDNPPDPGSKQAENIVATIKHNLLKRAGKTSAEYRGGGRRVPANKLQPSRRQ